MERVSGLWSASVFIMLQVLIIGRNAIFSRNPLCLVYP